VLLQNTTDHPHHWLGVELVGKPYRDAVGARVTLDVAGDPRVRTIKGGGSYLSSGDRRILFGLGAQTQADRLTVRWPSGRQQTFENVPIDRYSRLVEGNPEVFPAASAPVP